jgi:hypothetical protein
LHHRQKQAAYVGVSTTAAAEVCVMKVKAGGSCSKKTTENRATERSGYMTYVNMDVANDDNVRTGFLHAEGILDIRRIG